MAENAEGMQQARPMLAGVAWGTDSYEGMDGAAALLILTEWNAFRMLDINRVKSHRPDPLIIDLRNIHTLSEMEREYEHQSVGQPPVGTS